MEAAELYAKLDRDFIAKIIKDDDWARQLPKIADCLYPEFRANGGIGLMCDFAGQINRVFTAVFLSDEVIQAVLDSGAADAMLFVHHPVQWDLINHGGVYAPHEDFFHVLRERRIAVYVLHHPLDNYGRYSTSGSLADVMQIKNKKPAFLYHGAFCGLFGKRDDMDLHGLHAFYSQVLGHKTRLIQNGGDAIPDGSIAICAGCGFAMFVLEEMVRNNIRVLITGVTNERMVSQKIFNHARANGISVLGGTRWSSEKFALMAIVRYFERMGLPAEFIAEEPSLYDLSIA